MNKLKLFSLLCFGSITLSGCVIAPPVVRPVYVQPAVVRPVFVAPPGVVYIAPTYAVPAPGYLWGYHANQGWGWHHPSFGWHQGWR